MGTASSTKFIMNNAGTMAEQAAVITSAGAGDAQRVVALNASGLVDQTMLNVKNSSAGAGDASKVVILDAGGKIDITMMPTGLGGDSMVMVASENLAAGDLVNIWNNAGAAKVRKADGSGSGKEAHGFVLTAGSSGGNVTVYFEGTNTAVSSLTPGPQFLHGITAGAVTAVPPTGAGKTLQRVGFAISTTALNFQSNDPITLA